MQTTTLSTVIAIFNDSSTAQKAVDELRANGFSSTNVYSGRQNASAAASSGYSETSMEGHHHEGGIVGWFKSLFGDEDESTQAYGNDRSLYEDAANKGNVFVSVNVPDQDVDRAAAILERYSPVNIRREEENEPSTYGTASGRQTGVDTTHDRGAGENRAIPVVREDLKVGKRAVLRGGVRVYSRVIEEPVQEKVRLREEHVHVERTPVNRETTASDLRPGKEQVFEVKEYAEEPVVSKTSRVVEEVRIGKEATERTETVRDTIHRTEVNVENLNERQRETGSGSNFGGAQRNFDDDYRRDFQTNYGSSGARYEDYAPAYQYGYTSASDPRYRGKSFDEVESSLRQDYSNRYPNSTWEKMKNSVRYGWDKVTGKA